MIGTTIYVDEVKDGRASLVFYTDTTRHPGVTLPLVYLPADTKEGDYLQIIFVTPTIE
jgi:hypothetical protein